MTMKGLLILGIGLIIPILNYGQSELAMISDSDGFVNVLADKSPDSEIITTIKEGDFYYVNQRVIIGGKLKIFIHKLDLCINQEFDW